MLKHCLHGEFARAHQGASGQPWLRPWQRAPALKVRPPCTCQDYIKPVMSQGRRVVHMQSTRTSEHSIAWQDCGTAPESVPLCETTDCSHLSFARSTSDITASSEMSKSIDLLGYLYMSAQGKGTLSEESSHLKLNTSAGSAF